MLHSEDLKDAITHLSLLGSTVKKGEINYSVYSGLCTHPEVVRKHLDSGALSRAMKRSSRHGLQI